jgi:hypothetical protein
LLRGRRADALDHDVDGADLELRHAAEVLGDTLLHLTRDVLRPGTPTELDVHDDVCGAPVSVTSGAVPARLDTPSTSSAASPA